MRTFEKITILIIFVINIFFSYSNAMEVSGDVWGVWDSTMNPIEAVGELRVPPGSSLYIGPGCFIEFQGYYALTVDTSATLTAFGTVNDSIVFTPADTGIAWNGIDFHDADSGCTLAYCIIEWACAPSLSDISGGGIRSLETDINVLHCSIRNNSAPGGYGGGIFLDMGHIYLEGNNITNNQCGHGGAGYYSSSVDNGSAIIINNIFENNTTYYPLGGEWSGPLVSAICADIEFTGNIIRNNYSGSSVASKLSGSSVKVFNNIVSGNYGVEGDCGGLTISCQDSGYVAFNEITHNTSYLMGFCGGLLLGGSNMIVENNIIAFNESGNRAGGLRINGINISITNNIIVNNSAEIGGGAYIYNNSSTLPIKLTNNIIWGNSAQISPQIFIDHGLVEINYCDIEDTLWPGIGNINVDPLFLDTGNANFHLMSIACGDPYDSPCIDTGVPDISDSLLDCSWGLGGLRSDMGAYGGGGDSGTVKIIDDFLPLASEFRLMQNYPNPFNQSTIISYSLADRSYITIAVYNILGQHEMTLFEDIQQAGQHSITWDASDFPSGVYYARISNKNSSLTKKLLLLK